MRSTLLYQILDHWSQYNPSKSALIQEDHEVTYSALKQRSQQVAQALQTQFGIQKGDRIAILSSNCIEMVELLFAVSYIGAIYVPLNTRLSAEELAFIVSDSKPNLMVFHQSLKELSNQLNDLQPIAQRLQIQGTPESEIHPYEHLVTDSETPSSFPTDLSEHDPLMLIYTSGTTGKPKGAMLSHANNIWNCISSAQAVKISEDDVSLTILPLFHIGGWGLYLLPTLFQGGTVVIEEKFRPEMTFDLIEQKQITVVMGVPTIYNILSQQANFKNQDTSRFKAFVTGGAPCPVELLEMYHQAGYPLTQGFGMSETSPTVFILPVSEAEQQKGSVGRPVISVQAQVVDDEMNPLPPNKKGELVLRGNSIFMGYWDRPEATEKAFEGGWFHTGDLAYYDEKRYYYIVGRKKDMLISGGENVYPAEVEDVLFRHPAILDVSVFGQPDPKWGEIPVAAVVRKPDQALNESELSEWFQSKLARYKQPKKVFFCEDLPKNASGKVLKRELQKIYAP